MNGLNLVVGVFLAIPLGIGIALLICGKLLNSSNNFGDSTATLDHFSDGGILGKRYKDRVSKKTPLDDVANPRIIDMDRIKAGAAPAPSSIEREIENANVSNIKWHS